MATLAQNPKGLCGQLLEQMVAFLPEDGPILVVRDEEGRYATSDPDRIDPAAWQARLESLHCWMGDGWEPVTMEAAGYFVIGGQVGSAPIGRVSVFLLLPGYSQETATANMGLLETVLGQAQVVAELLLRMDQFERFLRFRDVLHNPD